jgi:hypothetical protein
VVINWPAGGRFFPSVIFGFSSFPFECSLLPGIDEPDDKDDQVGHHNDQGGSRHLFENEGPGKKEDHLDVKKKEDERDQIKLDWKRVDPLLEIRAAAFEGLFLGQVTPGRSQKLVHEDQNQAEKPEDEEDKKKFSHFSPS